MIPTEKEARLGNVFLHCINCMNDPPVVISYRNLSLLNFHSLHAGIILETG